MDQIRFIRVFSILWVREWSRFVWPNPFELFVTRLQTDLVPKSVCSSDTNLQTDFARGANYYYIWPMKLLELKYIMTSARNVAAIAKGMVELKSIVFYSREERGRWRQGPRCLRCSKLRRIGGLGGLMMTPRRSSGCGACIPELTIRRHRGRSQAPWTVVISWPPLLVGNTVKVVSSSSLSSTEFASTSLYNIYARFPSKLYVAHTHTPVPN